MKKKNALQRAVLTGANGMIGAALAEHLLSRGIQVLALVRPGQDGAGSLPVHPLLRVEACPLEALAAYQAPEKAPPWDVFFHLAWAGTYGPSRDHSLLQARNIQHTLDAVALAHRLGCTTFVGIGSQAEYGVVPPGQKLAPDTPTCPTTGYGTAKLAAGNLSRLLARQLGLRHHWVRILSVYGPWEKPHCLTHATIRKLLAGKPLHFTLGEQQWDFLYSEDAARALCLVAEKGRDGATYVLGSGECPPLAHSITTLCRMVRPDMPIGLGTLPYPPGQCMYLCADISALEADTGFRPQVSYREGLARTIQWVREQE